MPRERGANFEREFNTTESVTDRQIADFVISHESEKRLTAGFDFMLERGTFKGAFRDLFPYFEEECARTGAPNLKEVRRMTHYLDKRTGIQTDLPDETIIGILHELAAEQMKNDRIRMLGRDEASEIHGSSMEEIEDFQNNHHIELVLHKIELAIAELDRNIETAERADRGSEKERKTIAALRAARSTLLEKYFSPGSLN